MNKKRLLKLADFLETVPRRAFDIGGWQTKAPTKPEGKKQGECGFAGCAVGWATHAKLFRGLRLEQYFDGGVAFPVYEDREGFDACAQLFDIHGYFPPEHQLAYQDFAEYLFSPDAYETPPTPKQVAARIRAFVKDLSSPSGAA